MAGRSHGRSVGLMVWGGGLGSCMLGFLHFNDSEEPGDGRWVAQSHGRINGLGRRPVQLYVRIPAFGGARGRPVGRAVARSD